MKKFWEKYKLYKELLYRINTKSSFGQIISAMFLGIFTSTLIVLPFVLLVLYLIMNFEYKMVFTGVLFLLVIIAVFLYFFFNYFWLKKINKTLKNVHTRLLILFQGIGVSLIVVIFGVLFLIQMIGKV